MPRTAARFTQADLQRALRAMKAEDYNGSVEILKDGRIRIIPIDTSELPKAANKSAQLLVQL